MYKLVYIGFVTITFDFVLAVCLMVLSVTSVTASNEDQELQTKSGAVSVQFGMLLEKAERLLGLQATNVEWYKPEGIVKQINISGIRLQFMKGRLENIVYESNSADVRVGSPFYDYYFNPPPAVSLKVGVTHDRLVQIVGIWKASLEKIGYSEEESPHPEMRQFYFGPSMDGKTLWWIIGKRATWLFSLDESKVVKEISVTDNEFNHPFIFYKE